MTRILQKVFPFLRWFPIRPASLRADVFAGVTVALVLIPQSMAYAQLAGLPAYYGLYAAFLPVIVGALWGSSSQLATGPVAVVSLLTASALAPLAATGSEQFVALAIMLALLVGMIQFALGVFRLGALVNLISHPVIIGFMNAAAIIIGLSQLNKMIGVSMSRSDHFLNDIWGVLQQLADTHLLTLMMGASALLMMLLLKRYLPRLPGVLLTVVTMTLLSWAIGFENKMSVEVQKISSTMVRMEIQVIQAVESEISELKSSLVEQRSILKKARNGNAVHTADIATLDYQLDLANLKLADRIKENRVRFQALRRHMFAVKTDNQGVYVVSLQDETTAGSEQWHINKVDSKAVHMVVGGEVVGNIRPGLPAMAMPKLDRENFNALLSTAFVIALVAFMEAISIAKAMAARTRERIDPNRELIGQGLANITASFSQAFPVSGSFSRSAVNIGAGAVTGMSSVISGLLVLITLLFLTPLLYHLPQAVLAAIIMMAVVGLINFKSMLHTWQTQRHDGIAAIVTFFATLYFAPHLDMGILIGAGVAIVLFLLRQMHPRAVILGRLKDGRLGDIKTHHVEPVSPLFVALRYDGSLDFMNIDHFEDVMLHARIDYPEAKAILVVGDGINSMDASGEEKIRELIQNLKAANVVLAFCSLKKPVYDTFTRAGLIQQAGEENIYGTSESALQSLQARFSGVS